MATNRKSFACFTLGAAIALASCMESAEAGGRRGFSRGRSSISRRSSGRSMIRTTRSNPVRTRMNNRITNRRVDSNRRIDSNRRLNSNRRIDFNRRGNQKLQTTRRNSSRHQHGHHKHGLFKKGFHKHGHHHHHHHWGGWFGKGHHHHHHHGWGIGIYRRYRYFRFVFAPVVQSYCNPYCEAPGFLPEDGPAIDNSQPIQAGGEQGGQNEKGMALLMAASEAFSKGDFQTAMTNADAAAREMKNFPEVHQFRSLVLFAMQKYDESASAAHVGLSAGSGWNWTTLKSFYPNVAAYTAQLRSLESYVKANPKQAGGHFLLAYHYLMMGHGPAAVTELASVVELEPRDELSAKMLKAVRSKLGQPNNAQPAPQDNDNDADEQVAPENSQPMNVQPQQNEQPVAVLNPIGVWKATRDDGLVVTLTMTEDGKFSWNAVMKDRTIKFDGQFVLTKGEIKLTRSTDKTSLDGLITVASKDKFELRIKGRDPSAPGLQFVRQ